MADEPVKVSLYALLEPGGDLTLKDASMIRVLTAFADTGKIVDSCQRAGIARSSWYVWRRDNPDFNRIVEEILALREQKLDERVVTIEEKLFELAENGEMQAIDKVLKSRRDKYRDKQIITVVSPDVVSRLSRQADTIMQLCATELPEPFRTQFPAKLAEALNEVWS